MKKLAIILAFISASATIYAQGVKQLWSTIAYSDDYPGGAMISTDSAGNAFTIRRDFNMLFGGMAPIDLDFYNGKLYGTSENDWTIYEYDPLSKIFTGKVPMFGSFLGPLPWISLTRSGDVFYGITNMAVDNEEDPDLSYSYFIFEWHPSTNNFVIRHDFFGGQPVGKLVEKDNRFYGLTINGGTNNTGFIYEWDPVTNIVENKISFPADQGYPHGSLALKNGKFYGVASGNSLIYGSTSSPVSNGLIFSWDPVTNDFEEEYDFPSTADGTYPVGTLAEKEGKFYGLTYSGGNGDSGVIFEWDPNGPGSGYTRMKDLSQIDASNPREGLTLLGENLYGSTLFGLNGNSSGTFFQWNPAANILTQKGDWGQQTRSRIVIPAPISQPTPASCEVYPSVTINATNNNRWVPITDSKGDVLAEIHPHGNNLGLVTAQAYINNAAVRTDGAGSPYLDRNITITPAVQPAEDNLVDLRLYITKAELEALKAVQNSGITDINDIAIYKGSDECTGNVVNVAAVPTTYEDYAFGYVLKTSVNSFSSFFFSNRVFDILPLQFLAFSGIEKNNDAQLQWTTENEHNTLDFDVERSTDGNHFSVVGNVAANHIAGKHQYSFTDKNINSLSATVIYYRLKQRDRDGKAVYSKTVSLKLSTQNLFSISPNPAGNFINITYRKQDAVNKIIVQITDMSGRKVLEQPLNTSIPVNKINISTLSKGVYMISVVNNGERTTTKFVKE